MNSSQSRSKFDRSLATTLTLIFFACLALGPALFYHEPLKWQAAQAELQYENGDRNAAIQSLQEVAVKRPKDSKIQLKLVNWLAENGQADKAVEHCKEQLEHSPKSQNWLLLKREAECQAGDFKAAWQTFEQLKVLRNRRVNRSPEELNEQAYFRALAEEDLSLAADEIQRAVQQVSHQSGIPNFRAMLPSQALISASLLSRKVEAQSIVLPQLNRRIVVAQRALEDREKLLVESLADYSKESFPLSKSRESMLEETRVQTEFRRHELALLLVCRALILEDLQEPARCDLDRTHVVELGFQPQAVADLLPDDSLCLSVAMRAIAYLDTRGLVLTKMPWSDPGQLVDDVSTGFDAITDFDIAVAVSEVIDRVQQASKESSGQEQEQFRKVFAAILSHRAVAHGKAGRSDLVQPDRDRIEALGFDPDGNLY